MVKNPPASAKATGDTASSPESGRSLGGGDNNPLQYSCRETLMDRGAWRATVHGVAKSQTRLHYRASVQNVSTARLKKHHPGLTTAPLQK